MVQCGMWWQGAEPWQLDQAWVLTPEGPELPASNGALSLGLGVSNLN